MELVKIANIISGLSQKLNPDYALELRNEQLNPDYVLDFVARVLRGCSIGIPMGLMRCSHSFLERKHSITTESISKASPEASG